MKSLNIDKNGTSENEVERKSNVSFTKNNTWILNPRMI